MMKLLSIGYCLSVLALGFLLISMGPVWTQEANDSRVKEDNISKETLSMDDDLDDLNEELKPARHELEKVDIVVTLNRIIEKMGDAEDFLSRASLWQAVNPQEKAGQEIEKIIKEQEKARKALDKLFKRTKKSQKQAVFDISKLIKLARMQGKGQGQGSKPSPKPGEKPKPQDKQPQPRQTSPKQPGNPADKPYEATGTLPHHLKPFTDDLSKKWGNLPPKLRDAILEMKQDELISGYLERLEKYFKILASEE